MHSHPRAPQPPRGLTMSTAAEKVLLVEDDPGVLDYVSELLEEMGLTAVACRSGEEALDAARRDPDLRLVVTDLHLPGISGEEMLRRLQSDGRERRALIMSGTGRVRFRIDALRLKVQDCLDKPLDPARLTHALTEMRADLSHLLPRHVLDLPLVREALDQTVMQGMDRLMSCARLRDGETAEHCRRVGRYAGILAASIGLPALRCAQIEQAALLHDIGKIALPDHILFKNGPLTAEEYGVIKEHCWLGHVLLSDSGHPLMVMAAEIALNHHERWSGDGYPSRKKGAEIPLEARITAIADVYDALRMARAYKPAYDHDTATRIILEGDGRSRPEHFDPELLDAFRRNQDRFASIFESLPDQK